LTAVGIFPTAISIPASMEVPKAIVSLPGSTVPIETRGRMIPRLSCLLLLSDMKGVDSGEVKFEFRRGPHLMQTTETLTLTKDIEMETHWIAAWFRTVSILEPGTHQLVAHLQLPGGSRVFVKDVRFIFQ
jgi:hypothetical protein